MSAEPDLRSGAPAAMTRPATPPPDAPRAPRARRSEVALVAGGQLLQQALTLVTGVVIARMLGAADYGVVNLLRSLLAVALLIAPLGLDLALLRHFGSVSPHSPEGAGLLRRVRAAAFLLNAFAALVIGLGLSGLLEAYVFHYDGFAGLLAITLLALPLAADTAILGAVYRSVERPGSYALLTLYLQSILRVALVGVVFLAIPTLTAVVWINVVQAAVVAAAAAWHLNRLARRERAATPGGAGSWNEARAMLWASLAMAPNLLVYGLMRFTDLLMLGALGTAKDAGEYGALSTVSQLVQIYPLAASQSLGPRVSRCYARGDVAGMKAELDGYLRFASISAGFVFAGVAAFGDRLDLVFGPSFSFRSDVAFLLPLGYLLSGALAPMGFALSMTGRHRAELMILSGGLAGLVALCALLIPSQGQLGAAIAVAVAFAAVNLVRFGVVARALGFVPGRLADVAPPLVALVCAFGARALADMAGERTLFVTALGCVLYAALFGAIAILAFADDAARARLSGLWRGRT